MSHVHPQMNYFIPKEPPVCLAAATKEEMAVEVSFSSLVEGEQVPERQASNPRH